MKNQIVVIVRSNVVVLKVLCGNEIVLHNASISRKPFHLWLSIF